MRIRPILKPYNEPLHTEPRAARVLPASSFAAARLPPSFGALKRTWHGMLIVVGLNHSTSRNVHLKVILRKSDGISTLGVTG